MGTGRGAQSQTFGRLGNRRIFKRPRLEGAGARFRRGKRGKDKKTEEEDKGECKVVKGVENSQ